MHPHAVAVHGDDLAGDGAGAGGGGFGDRLVIDDVAVGADIGLGDQIAGRGIGELEGAAPPDVPDQAALDAAIAAIPAEALQAMSEAALGPLLAALESAGGFEAALATLAGRFPEMDSARLEDALGRAMFAAELWGYGHAGR